MMQSVPRWWSAFLHLFPLPTIFNLSLPLLLLLLLLLPLQKFPFLRAESQVMPLPHVYLFLREEETPVGKTVLSASRAFYLASAYAKRGVDAVVIEEMLDPPAPDFYHPDTVFKLTGAGADVFFSIDKRTGAVKTLSKIDFEDPALVEAGCVLRDDLAMSRQDLLPHINQQSPATQHCCFPMNIESSRERAVNVDICIEDINDNAPRWTLERRDQTGGTQVSDFFYFFTCMHSALAYNYRIRLTICHHF